MKRKVILILAAVVFVSLGVALFARPQKTVSPVNDKENAESKKEKVRISPKMKEYIDPSGFKIKYPDNLTLTRKDKLSDKTYSDFKLTSQEMPGSLTVNVKTTSQQTVEKWVNDTGLTFEDDTLTKSKLTDLQVRKLENDDVLVAVLVDEGILFTFTADYQGSRKVWKKVADDALDSFEFVEPQSAGQSSTSATTDSGGAVEDEGEELIE